MEWGGDDFNMQYTDVHSSEKIFRICIIILYYNGIFKLFGILHKMYTKYIENPLFY